MIRTLPSTRLYKYGYNAFIIFYFVLLFSPLIVIMVLAFNNSMFPSLPWNGFTLDWFFGEGPDKIGIFNDARNMKGLRVSIYVGFWVTSISTLIGTCAAFLFEQEEFRFKKFFYFLS
jgi:spermidine/putrescine transport system permease protein